MFGLSASRNPEVEDRASRYRRTFFTFTLIFVPQAVLDDLGRFQQARPEAEYVGLFDKHRAAIVKAAARAIDTGRVAPDRRVHLRHEDFGEFSR